MRNGGSERPTVRGVKFVDYKIKILLTDLRDYFYCWYCIYFVFAWVYDAIKSLIKLCFLTVCSSSVCRVEYLICNFRLATLQCVHLFKEKRGIFFAIICHPRLVWLLRSETNHWFPMRIFCTCRSVGRLIIAWSIFFKHFVG